MSSTKENFADVKQDVSQGTVLQTSEHSSIRSSFACSRQLEYALSCILFVYHTILCVVAQQHLRAGMRPILIKLPECWQRRIMSMVSTDVSRPKTIEEATNLPITLPVSARTDEVASILPSAAFRNVPQYHMGAQRGMLSVNTTINGTMWKEKYRHVVRYPNESGCSPCIDF